MHNNDDVDKTVRDMIVEKTIPVWETPNTTASGLKRRPIESRSKRAAIVSLLVNIVRQRKRGPDPDPVELEPTLAAFICEASTRAQIRVIFDMLDEEDVMDKLKQDIK